MDLSSQIEKITRLQVRRESLRKQQTDATLKHLSLSTRLGHLREGKSLVDAAMLSTQQQVKEYIEGIVSLALETVYGNEYGFELEYTLKRNQSEATPWIRKGELRFSPREEVGGGVNDIASFALRLALWSLTTPQPTPVFILDEPAKFLSRDKQSLFGQMLKRLSVMLGVQIVMVSHSADIIDEADVAWQITQTNGESVVERIER